MKSVVLLVCALAMACLGKASALADEGWINLLTAVDPQRDSLMHPWTLEGGELHSPVNAPHDESSPQGHETIVFRIPKLPQNYDLRFRVTRNKSGFTMVFPFIDNGVPAEVYGDGGPAGKQPLGIRGDRSSLKTLEKAWFPPGESHRVVIEVRESGVRVHYDDQSIADLSSAPAKSQADRSFYRPARTGGPIVGIGVCAGNITVHSAEYREVKADGQPVAVSPAVAVTPAATTPPAKAADQPQPAKPASLASDPGFAPELAPSALKYHADIYALNTQQQSVMARVSKNYLDALGEAEKIATGSGQIKALAAIAQERTAMQDPGNMPAFLPPDLPANLKNTREMYLESVRKTMTEGLQAKQLLETNYLRVLASIETKAPPGSELARQVAAEKEVLIRHATAAAASATAVPAAPTGPAHLLNGDFAEGDAAGFPKGWLYTNTPWIDPRTFEKKSVPKGLRIEAARDGSGTFARSSYANEAGYLAQMVEIPQHKREIVFRFHVRGPQPGRPESLDAGFRFFSKDHKFIPEPQNLNPVNKTSVGAWHQVEYICKLPVQAEFACIVIGSSKVMAGVYEFQRVEVTFR